MIPYFGGRLTFQVLGVSPIADAVLITQRTIFAISEKGETLRGVPRSPTKTSEAFKTKSKRSEK